MSWRLDHHPPGHWGEGEAVRWGVRLGALGLIVAAMILAHGMFHDASTGPSLQRVRLVNPTPSPPPPPPQEEQPQPEQKVQQEISAVDQQFATPGAAGEAGALGVDSEGDAGSDAFGLAAKPGGRDLSTYPEGSGYGLGSGAGGGTGVVIERLNANFGKAYEQRLGSRLEALLMKVDLLRHAAWRAEVIVWIDGRGILTRSRTLKLTGQGDVNDLLAQSLRNLDTVEAPPKGYRFPIRVVINSRMETRAP